MATGALRDQFFGMGRLLLLVIGERLSEGGAI
jgi:hypothetical protein